MEMTTPTSRRYELLRAAKVHCGMGLTSGSVTKVIALSARSPFKMLLTLIRSWPKKKALS
jgi:hypothetical protein